jgi:hypothetical protein
VAVSRSLRHVRSHTIDLIDTIIHQVQENLDESPYSCLLAFAGAPSRRHGKGKGSLGGAIWRGHLAGPFGGAIKRSRRWRSEEAYSYRIASH